MAAQGGMWVTTGVLSACVDKNHLEGLIMKRVDGHAFWGYGKNSLK
jgi:hypothetical protein